LDNAASKPLALLAWQSLDSHTSVPSESPSAILTAGSGRPASGSTYGLATPQPPAAPPAVAAPPIAADESARAFATAEEGGGSGGTPQRAQAHQVRARTHRVRCIDPYIRRRASISSLC
ncbi:unnamed protein product, partial [Pylaiella littoralis]